MIGVLQVFAHKWKLSSCCCWDISLKTKCHAQVGAAYYQRKYNLSPGKHDCLKKISSQYIFKWCWDNSVCNEVTDRLRITDTAWRCLSSNNIVPWMGPLGAVEKERHWQYSLRIMLLSHTIWAQSNKANTQCPLSSAWIIIFITESPGCPDSSRGNK